MRRSVSLPSLETAMYFSVAVSDTTKQVVPVQVIPDVSVVAVPPETMAVTLVPIQIGIRVAFGPNEVGLTMFPVITCDTFGLLVWL